MRGAPSKTAVRAWARLVKASQTIINGVEADVQAEGFPPLDWYDVLLDLDRAGGAGTRPADLCARLGIAQYNASRLTARMVKAGLIEKVRCADDGRGQILKISEQGRTTLRRMWSVYSASIQRRLGVKLPEDEMDILAHLLNKLA